jgi:hypothetical protein
MFPTLPKYYTYHIKMCIDHYCSFHDCDHVQFYVREIGKWVEQDMDDCEDVEADANTTITALCAANVRLNWSRSRRAEI